MPDTPFFDGRPRMSSPIKPKKKPVKALPYMALKNFLAGFSEAYHQNEYGDCLNSDINIGNKSNIISLFQKVI